MYRKVEDFLTDWENASAGTSKVFEAMRDEKLNQKIAEEHNSLGWLGWHLTTAPAYFLGLIGLKIDAPGNPKNVPTTVKEIVEGYKNVSQQIREQVKALTDEQLIEEIDQHGRPARRGDILRALIDHQTHHRGQMTVLLRQADLVVPGVMGPTKEKN